MIEVDVLNFRLNLREFLYSLSIIKEFNQLKNSLILLWKGYFLKICSIGY